MSLKLNVKSLLVGLLAGCIAVCLFGAASSGNASIYQLSMAANENYVVYGRIHTGTGKVETWKYLIGTQKAVPHLGDNIRILSEPDVAK